MKKEVWRVCNDCGYEFTENSRYCPSCESKKIELIEDETTV